MKKFTAGTNVILSLLGLLLIVIMVNYIASRQYKRFDWTSDSIFTLSKKTEGVVKMIDSKVTLYVLWSKADPVYSHLEELLASYKDLNSNIEVSNVDPDKNPEQFTLIQNKYGKIRVNQEGAAGIEPGIFVVQNENVQFLPATSFQEFGELYEDGHADQSPKIQFKAESQLTSALMKIVSKEKQLICFSKGHGEWKYDGNDRDSLRHIKKELVLDGFETKAITLNDSLGIKKDCHIVVVAGPQTPLLENEVENIERYYAKGGKLLLLLDPLLSKEQFLKSGLESFCAKHGIGLRQDFILETDPRRLDHGRPTTFYADKFYTHSAVKALSGGNTPLPVLFSIVRSLYQVDDTDVISDILATTTAMSWGETKLESIKGTAQLPEQDNFDTEGPLTIAMASVTQRKDKKQTSRMVVVGDSDFLSDELFMNASLYNRDFWSSIIGFLSARKELVSIAPKNPEQVELLLTDDDFANIMLLLIGEFLGIVAIGIGVRRRRRT